MIAGRNPHPHDDPPSIHYPRRVPALTFKILTRQPNGHARLGRVTTPHGSFDTPAFMPVGTAATVKGLAPSAVAGLGSQIILANTYHLLIRPGSDLIQRMGGLHEWMRWQGPILTDSGGFQVFSLAHASRINDDGVVFNSHVDGARVELTPERSIEVQNELGADIIMAFDDCPPAPERPADGQTAVDLSYADRVQQACDRTHRWLERCVAAHARRDDQALFGIVQGGTDLDQRTDSAAQVTACDLPGYAIGGVAVGESPDAIRRVVEHTAPLLPPDRPRYLMGVGYERDLLAAVRAGVDMFDCVLPTRNGRNANAFTRHGQIRLRNARFADDTRVIEPGCDCPACAGTWVGPPAASSDRHPADQPGFSRSYLRHLFMSKEMLGPILVSAHNIRHFQRFMLDIRRAIAENAWPTLAKSWPVLGECTPPQPDVGRGGQPQLG